MSKSLKTLHVRALSPKGQHGVLIAGNLRIPCRLGRSGASFLKREGDGTTPRGLWPMRFVLARPQTRFHARHLPGRMMKRDDGWCDDPRDRNYNRLVRLPYPASHEELWRKDALYDVVVVLGHNDRPRRRFGGSAIFFHIADLEGRPTAGCIAVSEKDMRKVLALSGARTRIKVW